jgi:hypothetical protein
VRFFRKEPLHRRLAREGRIDVDEPAPIDTTPRWGGPGVHGIPRMREWDAMAIAEAPDLEGDEVTFATLPDGTLIVDDEEDCAPLADALETQLAPPYRAWAIRRSETQWAVAGRGIEVVELGGVDGDVVDLTVREGERSLVVDGMPTFGGLQSLEQFAGERFEAYVAHAERLDEDLWDVRITPL